MPGLPRLPTVSVDPGPLRFWQPVGIEDERVRLGIGDDELTPTRGDPLCARLGLVAYALAGGAGVRIEAEPGGV